MVCSLFGAAFAAEEETATPYVIPDVDGKVVILHTNDTHGADLDEEGASFGMAGVAQLKKDFEAAGADVLLVSAGDSIMGKPLVSADQGKSAIEFMNAAGYDAMTVGNHELDFGIDNLKALAKDADFPILCADMTTEADGKTVFDSNKIFEIGGVKVGRVRPGHPRDPDQGRRLQDARHHLPPDRQAVRRRPGSGSMS